MHQIDGLVVWKPVCVLNTRRHGVIPIRHHRAWEDVCYLRGSLKPPKVLW